MRETILAATRRLLDERRFDEVSVADILSAADVARGSFYFYFESKHDVLAELVRRAVEETRPMAEPWLGNAESDDPAPGVRASHHQGALFWASQASLLRAIVENWRTDPQLSSLWLGLMRSYSERTQAQIATNQERGLTPEQVDPKALAAALTWLGERLYYLAAIDAEPFDDFDTLVDTLSYLWTATIYPDKSLGRPAGSGQWSLRRDR